jgi:hypothetical protein
MARRSRVATMGAMLSQADRSARRPQRRALTVLIRGAPAVGLVVAAVVAVVVIGDHSSSARHVRRPPLLGHAQHPVPPSVAPSRTSPELRLAGAELPVYQLASYLVDNLAKKTYPGDNEYFNGAWESPDRTCWMCDTSPGATAAVLSTFGGPSAPFYRRLAIQTFTDAIRAHRLANGSFYNAAAPTTGYGIPTIFFGVELGEAYLVLDRTLPAATRTLWAGTLEGAANYLVSRKILSYYINGNINLQATELLYDAWQATGSPKLHADYEASWAFTLHPGPAWRRYGLVVTKSASSSTGSNGSGYLSESSGDNPGFDPDYSLLQADEATRLYLLSYDPRALRLMGLLTNQLLPRVTPGFLLNTSGGSRHPEADRYIPFTDAGLPVLGWLSGQRRLAAMVPGQFAELRQDLCQNLAYPYINLYREMGNELSLVLLATQRDPHAVSASRLSSRLLCPNISPALRSHLVQ